jgi:hypothetical protein
MYCFRPVLPRESEQSAARERAALNLGSNLADIEKHFLLGKALFKISLRHGRRMRALTHMFNQLKSAIPRLRDLAGSYNSSFICFGFPNRKPFTTSSLDQRLNRMDYQGNDDLGPLSLAGSRPVDCVRTLVRMQRSI